MICTVDFLRWSRRTASSERSTRSWQRAYGFPAAAVVAWSGDNPCSLVGTGLLHEGQLAISLGTSDTIFGPMDSVRVSGDGTGHVFASPLGNYMGITVFSNGSLARERVREDCGARLAAASARHCAPRRPVMTAR